MSTPARPDLKFNSFDEMVNDAARLREGPYEKTGNWDLTFILAHLTKTMMAPFEYRGMRIPWPLSALIGFFYARVARSGKYPTIQLPMPKFFKPAEGISSDSAWDDFHSAIEKLKALTGPTLACPPLGTLNLEDFVKIQLLHGAHHLSFLKLKA